MFWRPLKIFLSGNLFDENFLMTIATLGAFVISAYEEAVGVMFFYRVGEYFEHRAVEKAAGRLWMRLICARKPLTCL